MLIMKRPYESLGNRIQSVKGETALIWTILQPLVVDFCLISQAKRWKESGWSLKVVYVDLRFNRKLAHAIYIKLFFQHLNLKIFIGKIWFISICLLKTLIVITNNLCF